MVPVERIELSTSAQILMSYKDLATDVVDIV